MNLANYSDQLNNSLKSILFLCPQETPYYDLAVEIVEMIQSYLDDSDYFSQKNDFVNQYASLCYAHGWMHAGSYLGLYIISDVDFLCETIILPDSYNLGHLQEKTTRYTSMLTFALESVNFFPSKGSPLSRASDKCMTIAKSALINSGELEGKGLLTPALGHLCYGYGWLDTFVRAGLLSIQARPELFTTEC